ncbi:MAG: D-glycero-alpha-D-manno-heptose-1,7-bisphosphate 7-phosphatase [Leptospirillia bacterium]
MNEKKRPVVLADRDGTLIRDVPYLSRISEIALLPGVAEAIGRLNRAGIPVAIVTNQSGVARGHFSESFVPEAHARLMELLEAEGAKISGIYYCPHLRPEEIPRPDGRTVLSLVMDCDCRKPAPGLLLRALSDFAGDPFQSAIIGDADRDIAAGRAAGCKEGYRILGENENPVALPGEETTFVRSFSEAVDLYLKRRPGS